MRDIKNYPNYAHVCFAVMTDFFGHLVEHWVAYMIKV
jgi:hypothetical protein